MKYKLFAKIIKPLILAVVIFGSFFASNFVSASVDLSSGLIGHYKMNDSTSTTAVVDSAGGNNGAATANTDTLTTTGVVGGAINLASSNYITLSSSVVFGDNGTVNLWVENYAEGMILIGGTGVGGGVDRYLYWHTDGNLYIGSNTYPEQVNWSSSGINFSGWHMISITKTGTTVELFIDTVSQGTRTLSTLSNIAEIGRGIYANSDYRYLNTKIDDVRIYNRAINTDEIAAIYNSGSGTEEGDPLDLNNGMVAHYTMDDNAGDTTVLNSNGDTNGIANFNTSANSVAGVSASTTPITDHGALTFNGSGEYVEIPTIDLSDSWTISSWFTYPFPSAGWNTLTRGVNNDHQVIVSSGIYLGTYDNEFGSAFHSSGFDTRTLSTGWHHLVAVGSGTATNYYIDGSFVGAVDFKSTSEISYIGNYQGGGQQFGTIDDFRFYNRPLNTGEISALYNGGAGTQVGDMPGGEVGHWRMNDISGTSVTESVNGYFGTSFQDLSFMTILGKIGNALGFNGTSDSVNIGNPSGLQLQTFTALTWIKPNAQDYGFIFSYAPTGSSGWGMVYGNTWGSYQLHFDDAWVADVLSYSVDLNDGNYHQVGIYRDLSNSVGIIVDGQIVATSYYYNTFGFSNFNIGSRDGNNIFNGSIDDVRIYDKALTQTDIDMIWNGGSGTEAGQSWGSASSTSTSTSATKYWVGNGGYWSDSNNWSASSGGSGGAGVPVAGDTVIFDSANSGSCYVDVDTNVDNIQILDGYYGSIYQYSSNTITTTNGISQGYSTGTFYGGQYGNINAGGNISFYNFGSYLTNISANGSVYLSTNSGDINLNYLYSNYGTDLYTYSGSIYVNDWNSPYDYGDTVYAQNGSVYIYSNNYNNINLGSLYSSYGTYLTSYSYGNVYVNDWNSYGYSDTVYSQNGSVYISSYSTNLNLYSSYSYNGTSLNSYSGNIYVQDLGGYSNQVYTYYGSVNLYNYYSDIYLNSLTGSNITLSPNYYNNYQGTVYQYDSFYLNNGGTLSIYGSLNNYYGYSINGNVDFVGTADAYISGNGSPYIYGNFTCNQPGKHLYFQSGYTTNITGDFHIAGADSNPVYLMSQSPGSQWQIDPQGTRSVDYAWVQDSNNVNATSIEQTNSIDGDNNTNWTFGPTAPSCVAATDDPLYTVCTYTRSDTFTVPEGVTKAQVLVVAGGGGGGYNAGGGGGGGGVIYNNSVSLSNTTYEIIVGAGGSGSIQGTNSNRGYNGEDSSFSDIIASGGGGGGGRDGGGQSGADGSSGGGGAGALDYGNPFGGTGTQGGNGGYGYSNGPSCKYVGAGGGGANENGVDATSGGAGNGGDGISNTITGTSVIYGGGGGGGWTCVGSCGQGGSGGGGSCSIGQKNTGGGGSGNNNQDNGGNGFSGGSGIVIVRYLNPLGTGLVAHYKMNDNLATHNVVDSSLNDYTGTTTRNTSAMHVAGKTNGALVFNGNDDYITIPDNSNFKGMSQLSISLWAKFNSVYDGEVLLSQWYGGGSDRRFIIQNYSSGLHFGVNGDSYYANSSQSIPVGQWLHIVGVYDSITNKLTLYQNGVIIATGSSDGGNIVSNDDIPMHIGADYSGSMYGFFDGSIDDVRIYKRALSQADVAALYNWGDGTEDDGAAAITVSSKGTQISTTTIPIDVQDLGGAFLLTSTVNNATTTSIKLKKTGSLSTSTISNIILTYKDAESGQCSATKPGGTATFGTAGSFDENNFAITTGTMNLNQDTPVCLYINYDLIGDFSTSSIGSSIDFEISNPSTDIVITGGVVSTTNSVNISGQTIVTGSTGSIPSVNPTSCTDSGITSLLSLKMKDLAQDPTVFYLENCAIWKIVGGGTPIRLTNPNLQVRSLDFTNLTGAKSGGTVKINMSISNVDASSNPSYINTSKTYSTTATVKSWGGN